MSRRRAAERRKVLPDPKFGSVEITKFMNCLMLKGKKSVAERIMYQALDMVSKTLKQDPLEAFKEALKNVKPAIEVRSRRVGGATYQVPVEVRHTRALALAIRWIINAARARNERTMTERLAKEIMDSVAGRGGAAGEAGLRAGRGLGMTDDTPLAYWFRHERAARIYDGPDEVHKWSVARRIFAKYQ